MMYVLMYHAQVLHNGSTKRQRAIFGKKYR